MIFNPNRFYANLAGCSTEVEFLLSGMVPQVPGPDSFKLPRLAASQESVFIAERFEVFFMAILGILQASSVLALSRGYAKKLLL